MKTSFDEIILTLREYITLIYISICKRVNEDKIDESILNTLLEHNFISYNLSGIYEYGSELRDGTVSVTDTYRLFKKFKRNIFFKNFVKLFLTIIGLIISFIALFI